MSYGGYADDIPYSIVQTSDGGYALTGLTYSFGPPPAPNIFVLKLNSLGLFQWLLVYWMIPNHWEDDVPGDSNDEVRSVAIDSIGQILVAGWTASYCQPGDPANLFVGLFNYAGTMIGSWNYGLANGSEKVLDDRSLISTPDPAIVVCGPTTSVGPGLPNPNN